jgi:hypothetical protein
VRRTYYPLFQTTGQAIRRTSVIKKPQNQLYDVLQVIDKIHRLLWLNGSFLRVMIGVLLKERVKTYQMEPMTPINNASTFFSVFTYIVYDSMIQTGLKRMATVKP